MIYKKTLAYSLKAIFIVLLSGALFYVVFSLVIIKDLNKIYFQHNYNKIVKKENKSCNLDIDYKSNNQSILYRDLTFEKGFFECFLKEIKDKDIQYINIFGSGGGNVQETYFLIHYSNKHNLKINIFNQCASACAEILFYADNVRVSQYTEISIHYPFISVAGFRLHLQSIIHPQQLGDNTFSPMSQNGIKFIENKIKYSTPEKLVSITVDELIAYDIIKENQVF